MRLDAGLAGVRLVVDAHARKPQQAHRGEGVDHAERGGEALGRGEHDALGIVLARRRQHDHPGDTRVDVGICGGRQRTRPDEPGVRDEQALH